MASKANRLHRFNMKKKKKGKAENKFGMCWMLVSFEEGRVGLVKRARKKRVHSR